ncbi:MAG: aminomethyltransferase [Halanaerobiales bacterium]|nr:aminomethyltransferase [Halanaerobiales bacterium]
MKKTPLNQVHRELGAKLIEFGGWEMPVQYTGILQEHQAVREKCGLFDVSHMGEIHFAGPGALATIQHLITNDAARLKVGQILYTPMCYPDGGIVDDLLVYRLGEEEFLMVVNAANTDKDFEWVKDNSFEDVKITNQSADYAQLALQGPEAKNILQQLTEIKLDDLKYYWFERGEVAGTEVILSRTGYTGELGYEIYLKTEDAVRVWNRLMETGKEYGLLPAGLGARDTLRLEKKFCLYGNDIDENRHPLEAGLGWTVKFSKKDFIGRETLLKYKEEGYDEKLVGFKLIERGIARHGYKIKANGEDIGIVTSGSFSPTLRESIGLGYVKREKAGIGQEIEIVIRKRPVAAEIVETPFVK